MPPTHSGSDGLASARGKMASRGTRRLQMHEPLHRPPTWPERASKDLPETIRATNGLLPQRGQLGPRKLRRHYAPPLLASTEFWLRALRHEHRGAGRSLSVRRGRRRGGGPVREPPRGNRSGCVMSASRTVSRPRTCRWSSDRRWAGRSAPKTAVSWGGVPMTCFVKQGLYPAHALPPRLFRPSRRGSRGATADSPAWTSWSAWNRASW